MMDASPSEVAVECIIVQLPQDGGARVYPPDAVDGYCLGPGGALEITREGMIVEAFSPIGWVSVYRRQVDRNLTHG